MSRRRRLAIAGGIVVALGAAAYVTGYVLTGSRLPADTTVAGVDVGGMSPAEARTALSSSVEKRFSAPIVAVHDRQEFQIVPAKAGLAVDVPASIAAAGGQRSWRPRAMIDVLFGGSDRAPVLDVDSAKLDDAIAQVAEAVDEPVVEPLITFPDAKPKARNPRAGNEVVHDRFTALIRSAWLMDDDPITVPVDRVQPSVDVAGLRTAMTQIAEPAVAAPVVLQVGGQSVDLPVTAYAPALSVVAKDGAMVAQVDAKDLAQPLTDSTTGIGTSAVDASFRFNDGTPTIVPSKPGLGLDPAAMAEQLPAVLSKSGAERTIAIDATPVQPSFTTADAEKLGIKELVGEFTTEFPYAEYRNINQSEASRRINGTIVKPGATFSFNKTVGERTEANGFVTGFVINGGVFREETGGGVSQVATTTYNAAFFAGLDDVEHHPHAFWISRYPKGREATVYWGHLDLRFKNPHETGIVVRAWVDKSTPSRVGKMHVQMYGTKYYDVKSCSSAPYNFRQPGSRTDKTDACVPQDPIQGFDIDIHRDFYQNGTRVRTEKRTATYQAADKVTCK